METLKDAVCHPVTKLVFMVVVVLLLIMVYMQTMPKKTEGLVDFYNRTAPFDYGIKQRFGGVFSSTNQGEPSVTYNDTLKTLIPGLVPRSESLVGGREPPVFNEIGDELTAYRSNESTSENFTNARQVTQSVEDELLARNLGVRTM